MQMQAGAERFGAKTEYGEVLEAALANDIKRIRTDSGEYEAKTVILATGANPRPLGLDREESFVGRGVHYCAHCDGRFYKDKTVMVVGGGNTAAADAAYLSRLSKKVILVHRRDTLRATKIYHDPLMQAENVEFLWNSTVTALHGEGRLGEVTVSNVKTGDSQTISIDGLFVSIGRIPVTEPFAKEVLLDAAGYVVADETTKTNLPGVFAAGDLRAKALRQVVTAVSDGAVAAHFAEEYLNQNK
jgi:thioredoxin reductase (NADPH)